MGGIGGPEAYGAGLGRAVETLGERVRKMAEDVEDTQTLEAFNAFKREAFEYHEDPDKGLLNTRLGNGAVGVYRDADAWMGNKAGEYEAHMPSARSAQNFRRMAEQYRMQRGERNSRFEADQIKAYRDGEADATIRLGLDEIAEQFDDDKAVEAARQHMMLALELKTRGMGTEARRATYEAMEGQISMIRLARMIQKDPVKAEAWFRDNKDSFSGADLARAEGAVERAAEIYRLQEAVDELVQRFGPGREQEGVAWIRANKGGEEEERLVSAYKQRIGEMTVNEVNADAELRKQQVANFDEFYKRTWGMGQPPSLEEATQAMMSDKISTAHHEKIKRWLEVDHSRAGIEKELSASPGWYDLTPQQQEERVLIAAGRSKKDNEAAIADIKVGILNGTITESDITDYFRSMWITSQQKDQLKQMFLAQKSKPQQLLKRHMAELETDLMNVFSEKGATGNFSFSGIKAYVIKDFARRALELDPNSKTYPEDLKRIRGESLSEGVKLANQPEKTWSWSNPFGLFGELDVITPFGQRVEDAKKNIADFNESLSGEDRDIRAADLPDARLPRQGASRAGNIGGRTPPVRGETPEMNVIIDEASVEFGVDPDLVRAVIKQESGWKPKAVSHAGAQGLMQLIPETAKGLGVTDSFDIRQNIRGGTKLLGQLLQRYDGDMERALVAYNAGSARADQDRSKWPKETKRYVPAVLSHYKNIKQGKDKGQSIPAPAPAQPKGPAMLNGVQLGPTREAAAKLAQQEGKEPIDSILFGGKDGI